MSERVLSPKYVLAVTGAMMAAVALVFWPTSYGMALVWSQSNTFSYGFLVLPMAFWSIWRSSQRFGEVAWRPSWLGLLAVLPAAAAWYVGEAVDVQALAQYGMIGLFLAGCWAVLGNSAANRLRFGLGFTLFAVPVGEFMIPWLMDITADFTVAAVHMTGIPVYRTERFFTLPSGHFEVIEACSGIRFLMVTIVIATWFAQQTYTALWRKLAFVALAAVIMNIANGLRAFIIVLLVHYSEGRIAVGYDHLVLGWVAFVIGLFVTVKLGRMFADGDESLRPAGGALRLAARGPVAAAAIAVVAVLVVARSGEAVMSAQAAQQRLASLLAPASAAGWVGPNDAALAFKPDFKTPDQATSVRYETGGARVDLHQFKYSSNNEIIHFDNRLYDPDAWRLIEKGQLDLTLPGDRDLRLSRRIIERDGERLLMLSWYDIGGRVTQSRIEAKWFSALRSVVGGQPSDLMFAVVKTTDDAHDETALTAFVAAHYDALRLCARGQTESARCTGIETAQASR
ncbi:MAG: exosortase A [Pseudomonadota bacterium]